MGETTAACEDLYGKLQSWGTRKRADPTAAGWGELGDVSKHDNDLLASTEAKHA